MVTLKPNLLLSSVKRAGHAVGGCLLQLGITLVSHTLTASRVTLPKPPT